MRDFTFCANTFLEGSNQSEIRNEIDCYTYRVPQPPLAAGGGEGGTALPLAEGVAAGAGGAVVDGPEQAYLPVPEEHTGHRIASTDARIRARVSIKVSNEK